MVRHECLICYRKRKFRSQLFSCHTICSECAEKLKGKECPFCFQKKKLNHDEKHIGKEKKIQSKKELSKNPFLSYYHHLLSQIYLWRKCQRCPNTFCLRWIERNGGCQTIHCVCNETFCFNCGGETCKCGTFRDYRTILRHGFNLFFGATIGVSLSVVFILLFLLYFSPHVSSLIPLDQNVEQCAVQNETVLSSSICQQYEILLDNMVENILEKKKVLTPPSTRFYDVFRYFTKCLKFWTYGLSSIVPIQEISDDYTIQVWEQKLLSYLILITRYETWTKIRKSKEKRNLCEEINKFNEWVSEINKEMKIWSVVEQQTVDLQSLYWKNIYKIRSHSKTTKILDSFLIN